MRLGDTIVAPSTGAGASALAVVRVSGDGALHVVRRGLGCEGLERRRGAFVVSMALGCAEPMRGLIGGAVGGVVCVPALALVYVGPSSYTGEDVVELEFPGQAELVRRVVDALACVEGARIAEPGEFTARAFLNGRLTAERAEGVRAVIEARSSAELVAASRLMDGTVGRTYREIADELAGALALVEAGIDFVDQEDVVAITPADLVSRLDNVLARLATFVGDGHRGAEQGSGGEASAVNDALSRVVLAGRPNAGKSTLFNALLGRERAVVSELAGTTRDAIVEALRIDADASVALVDVAGVDCELYEAHRGSGGSDAERAAQKNSLGVVASCDVVVWCDPLGRFELDEPGLMESVSDGTPILRVRTKADLGVDLEADGSSADGVLAVCALDGWGVDALRRAIGDAATARDSWSAEGMMLAPRHRRALWRAFDGAVTARETAAGSIGVGRLDDAEVVAGAMRQALDAVGEVAGAISPDDVIGRIFATFCIGK